MLRSHPIVSVPLLLGLVLLASQTLAADFTSRVAGVSDSDTITVLHSGKAEPEQYDHPNLPLMREPTWIERFGRWFKEKIHLRSQDEILGAGFFSLVAVLGIAVIYFIVRRS